MSQWRKEVTLHSSNDAVAHMVALSDANIGLRVYVLCVCVYMYDIPSPIKLKNDTSSTSTNSKTAESRAQAEATVLLILWRFSRSEEIEVKGENWLTLPTITFIKVRMIKLISETPTILL